MGLCVEDSQNMLEFFSDRQMVALFYSFICMKNIPRGQRRREKFYSENGAVNSRFFFSYESVAENTLSVFESHHFPL